MRGAAETGRRAAVSCASSIPRRPSCCRRRVIREGVALDPNRDFGPYVAAVKSAFIELNDLLSRPP